MEGLEERFRVNDRDRLADALSDRLHALDQNPSKHHPELLFFLLELSDQPTFKSRLSDLEAFQKVEEQTGPALRWEDIAQEDGWGHDAALWKTISYEDSSEDGSDGEHSTHESESTLTTNDGDAAGRTAESFVIHPEDIPLLNAVREAQEWRSELPVRDASGNTRKTAVPEVHVLREVLFVLQGLETTLFDARGAAVPAFQMGHIAWETHKALINAFAESGRQLGVLREFAEQPQTSPHLQVFQDCIIKRLRDLDSKIVEIQTRLASPKGQVVVSLVAVKVELLPWVEPLYALADILFQAQDNSDPGTFRYLELLFDEAAMAQLAGRPATYQFLARIFVECFNVYLRPIRHWMDEGKLLPGDEIFFVSESPDTVPLSDTWRNRFNLRQTANGTLHAPSFLHPAAGKIFNAGKNIVVLRQLGKYGSVRSQSNHEPPLDYDAICPKGFDMAPFPELFGAAFEAWIQSKYRKTSTTLRDVLFQACGLSSALDALQYLYFMSDGSAAASFCEDMFGKLDALDLHWHDRYALTGIGQEIFAPLVDSGRLSLSVGVSGQRTPATAARSSVRTVLPTIKITYRLAWPVQMVVPEESMAHYQSVFTLLLQIRRAMYILHKPKMLDNYWTDDDNWDERALFYSSRRNLLWFCATLQTYLSTLVLEPNVLKMRQDLRVAQDVDAMISIHGAFMKQVIDEACLGSRLAPIRECILDMLDLAIKLDDARVANVTGQAASKDELVRKRKLDKSYLEVLREVKADFDRHMRFICGGLRSVARATSDAQSAKWDILAEMLQTGESG